MRRKKTKTGTARGPDHASLSAKHGGLFTLWKHCIQLQMEQTRWNLLIISLLTEAASQTAAEEQEEMLGRHLTIWQNNNYKHLTYNK